MLRSDSLVNQLRSMEGSLETELKAFILFFLKNANLCEKGTY